MSWLFDTNETVVDEAVVAFQGTVVVVDLTVFVEHLSGEKVFSDTVTLAQAADRKLSCRRVKGRK
jgi:hypothetical protein